MSIDPITVEVIRNAFMSIASQMNNNLARSAYTPIIYEMKDCSVGLFDSQARLVGQAPGLPIFLGDLETAIRVTTEHFGGTDIYQPGDVYAVNDSYLVGSHLNDVSVFSPIFHLGELVGFGATKAHWMDIGSKDPGQSMDGTEIYQEGYRIGPTHLYRARTRRRAGHGRPGLPDPQQPAAPLCLGRHARADRCVPDGRARAQQVADTFRAGRGGGCGSGDIRSVRASGPSGGP